MKLQTLLDERYTNPNSINVEPAPAIARSLYDLLDHDGGSGPDTTLYEFYRGVYKGVDCGPMIGFLLPIVETDYVDGQYIIHYEWRYGDDLPRQNVLQACPIGISVSSIVEGSDVEVEGDRFYGTEPEDAFTREQFWELVEAVDKEAAFYWKRDNSIYYRVEGNDELFWCQWVEFDDEPEGNFEPETPEAEFCKKVGHRIFNEDYLYEGKNFSYVIDGVLAKVTIEPTPDFTY